MSFIDAGNQWGAYSVFQLKEFHTRLNYYLQFILFGRAFFSMVIRKCKKTIPCSPEQFARKFEVQI